MSKENYFEKLCEKIIEGNIEESKKIAEKLLNMGISPLEVVDKSIKKAMDIIGEKYEKLEIFLPEMVLAADAAYAALNVLLPKEEVSRVSKGKVIIGTIYGDIHDIGKNIVAALLRASGYNVIDLGADVEVRAFVEQAKNEKASIIGISCLLTASMYYMRDVIQRLKDENIRDKFYVIVGGAAVHPEWAKEINADGWAKDAERAIKLCDFLIEKGKEAKKPIIMGEWE